jgi:hypothetical protein
MGLALRGDVTTTEAIAVPAALPVPGSRSVAYIVQWLRELEECRVGGLTTDEEYAVERAEKLSELLCTHRKLWIAPIVAAGSPAALLGNMVWMACMDWQLSALAAGWGGLFGLVMLARPCRDSLKNTQIRDRLATLNALLSLDLVTSDEFIIYEERLLRGESNTVGNL